MGLTAADYRAQLQALLPQGPAWPREEDATLTKFLAGLAEELARVDARAQVLIEEADPRTTLELLPDWERVAGLPDTCTVQPDTLQERRAALVAKLTALGGASRQYFIDVAAALGFAITITELGPFLAGHSAAGDAAGSEAWRPVWRVNAAEFTITSFAAGISAAGEPLRDWGNEILECVLRRLKPAHTEIEFFYS